MKADFRLPHFLSKEVKDLINHVLVPDPDLRFGIKQIKQHKWFNIYTPKKDISKGVRIGVDEPILFPKLLKEMKDKCDISERFVKQCIQANRHNAITSHYYLLMKAKILNGESLDDNGSPDGKNEIDFCAPIHARINKSVCAPRSTKNGHQHLRKIAEGLGDLNVMRVNSIQHNPQISEERKSP